MSAAEPNDARADRGAALVMTLLAMGLLTAIGVSLIVLSSTESRIATNYRVSDETFYAADAAIERALQDVAVAPSWSDLLAGAVRSTFVDATRTPTLPSGERLDLNALTAELQAQANELSSLGRHVSPGQLAAILLERSLSDREHQRRRSSTPSDAESAEKL